MTKSYFSKYIIETFRSLLPSLLVLKHFADPPEGSCFATLRLLSSSGVKSQHSPAWLAFRGRNENHFWVYIERGGYCVGRR